MQLPGGSMGWEQTDLPWVLWKVGRGTVQLAKGDQREEGGRAGGGEEQWEPSQCSRVVVTVVD